MDHDDRGGAALQRPSYDLARIDRRAVDDAGLPRWPISPTAAPGLLVWYGIQRLCDRSLPDDRRRQGWWSVNLGLTLVAVSMILFVRT